jgi:hypothetical protein
MARAARLVALCESATTPALQGLHHPI